MADLANRPRVFLSHSSLDKPFINKLNEDLKKCKIDTWLDTEEIRDGQPWMKAIFQGGIPTCDAVIVYLTENSTGSKMVNKELDAAFLHQLDNEGVTVLPYVSTASVRGQLRADLRTLQCRVWDEQNYREILPSVVAEIWRSYLERAVNTAISKEKIRRLELELENQQLKQVQEQTVFTRQEDGDFQYIYQALGTRIEVRAGFWVDITDSTSEPAPRRPVWDTFELSPLEILLYHLDTRGGTVSYSGIGFTIIQLLKQAGYSSSMPDPHNNYTDVPNQQSLQSVILMFQTFGLLTPAPASNISDSNPEYTDKLFRFRYWLIHNNLYPISLSVKYIGRV